MTTPVQLGYQSLCKPNAAINDDNAPEGYWARDFYVCEANPNDSVRSLSVLTDETYPNGGSVSLRQLANTLHGDIYHLHEITWEDVARLYYSEHNLSDPAVMSAIVSGLKADNRNAESPYMLLEKGDRASYWLYRKTTNSWMDWVLPFRLGNLPGNIVVRTGQYISADPAACDPISDDISSLNGILNELKQAITALDNRMTEVGNEAETCRDSQDRPTCRSVYLGPNSAGEEQQVRDDFDTAGVNEAIDSARELLNSANVTSTQAQQLLDQISEMKPLDCMNTDLSDIEKKVTEMITSIRNMITLLDRGSSENKLKNERVSYNRRRGGGSRREGGGRVTTPPPTTPPPSGGIDPIF